MRGQPLKHKVFMREITNPYLSIIASFNLKKQSRIALDLHSTRILPDKKKASRVTRILPDKKEASGLR